MGNFKWIDKIFLWAVLIGALNWGSIAFFGYNFVEKLFTLLTIGAYVNWAYYLVGIAAVVAIFRAFTKK
jgi:uncharacterized membrane protein YuzA (DUF378 family)